MKSRFAVVTVICTLVAATAFAGVEIQPAFPSLSFVSPVDLQNAGDGSNRLFVVEKRGRIYVFENHADVTAASLFLNIESRVNAAGSEEGLLGLAFHPMYPDTPYFYVNYTASSPRRTVIERYAVTANPDSADFSSNLVLLEIDQPYANHNAGQLAFGPDGMLYIGTGDGGAGGDPDGNGQNLQTLLGALLRIDIDSTSAGLNYRIPPDNPFFNNASGYREEIWAYGLRNPWRFSFDHSTGRLWLADVGQNQWEEIDIIDRGGNYGWNILEGSHCYPNPPCDSTGLELPIWEYSHPGGAQRSVTGGYVYGGADIPELASRYVYGDYITGEVWALAYDGVNPVANAPLLDAPFAISSFGVDENSNLFVLSYNGGTIWRFVPTATSVSDNRAPASTGALGHNSPNPFNPQTTIEFTLYGAGVAQIEVYDVNGRRVDESVKRPYRQGTHYLTWRPDATVPSGVYFYRLLLNGTVIDTKRMVLLK